MNKQPFIERMLETENLTDELEDSDANWLLNWGISKMDEVLQGIDDRQTAGERVNALMAVMRKINRILGNYADKDPSALAGDLFTLHGLFAEAFASGESPAPDEASEPPAETQPIPPQFEEAAERLSNLSTRQALAYLALQFYPQHKLLNS